MNDFPENTIYDGDKIVVTPNDDVDISVLFGKCKDNYKRVILTDSFGRSVKALYDESREIFIFSYITTAFANASGLGMTMTARRSMGS